MRLIHRSIDFYIMVKTKVKGAYYMQGRIIFEVLRYYFGSVLSSLLILVDRLFDFYQSRNTAAALGGRSAQPLSSV